MQWFADESLVLDGRASLEGGAFAADCRGGFGEAGCSKSRLFPADCFKGDAKVRAFAGVCCGIGGEFTEAPPPVIFCAIFSPIIKQKKSKPIPAAGR